MRTAACLFTGAALVALLNASPSVPAAASAAASEPDPGLIGIRLLDAPVVRRDDPRAMTYIVDHLKPGTTIRRHLEISNKSSVDRTVELYPAAATIRKNHFTFADGHKGNALTGWTAIKPVSRTVGPYGRFKAKVTIKVPKTAKPGERYAVLWAESTMRPDDGHNIGLVTRVGVRVYLDVANGGEYSDFSIDKVIAARSKDGRPRVIARVHNTGKRALDMEGELHLTDGPNALSAGPYLISPGTTLPPGGTGTVTVNVPQGLPSGPWTAQLRLRSGTVKHTVTAKLTFPRPGTTASAQLLVTRGLKSWYGAGIVLAVVSLAATLHRRLRLRRRRADPPSP